MLWWSVSVAAFSLKFSWLALLFGFNQMGKKTMRSLETSGQAAPCNSDFQSAEVRLKLYFSTGSSELL